MRPLISRATCKHKMASAHNKRRPKKYTVRDYLDEPVNFGGEIARRGDVIETLRSEGAPDRLIQIYMSGLLTEGQQRGVNIVTNDDQFQHNTTLADTLRLRSLIGERVRTPDGVGTLLNKETPHNGLYYEDFRTRWLVWYGTGNPEAKRWVSRTYDGNQIQAAEDVETPEAKLARISEIIEAFMRDDRATALDTIVAIRSALDRKPKR